MNRKDEHILYALKLERKEALEDIELITVEPTDSNDDIEAYNTSVMFLGNKVSYPNYINAMTGGGTYSYDINRRLSKLSKEYKIPLMSGSMHHYLKTGEKRDFLPIKKAFMPIVNLSTRASLDDIKRCQDLLDTPYVCMHVNTMQELLQKEGVRSFKDNRKNLEKAAKEYSNNFIVKAVGQGFSKETLKMFKEMGIKNVDISGNEGTDFSLIESLRQYDIKTNFISYKTSDCILWAKELGLYTIASGGIDGAAQIVKALALGADITASSYYYLDLINRSYKDAKELLEFEMSLLRMAMLLIGVTDLSMIKGKYTKR